MIDLISVSKSYETRRGPILTLSDISLKIAPGEFVSILGPSGCGKSTLLKCIAGIEPISSGKILMKGVPVKEPPDFMGFVFQRDLLVDWRTVLANVTFGVELAGRGRKRYTQKAIELLRRFGLNDYIHRYPWEMSGGMRQRAAICRALVDDPDLLLMDEPFGALDALTRDDLNLELQRIWSADRKTVLFVTHSIPESVFLSDRVVVMDRNPGRVAAVIDIDLPRPRRLARRDDSRFVHFATSLRTVLEDCGVTRKDEP